jgi:hypothetical protein
MNLQSGNLVKVLHNGKEGIGYIYDNGAIEESEKVLHIGVSWKEGGVANLKLQDAIDSGAEIQIVRLERTFEEKLVEASQEEIERAESDVLDYFEFSGIDTEDQLFDIVAMARETGIELPRLEMLLVNLEDEKIMEDIVSGYYESFDPHDRDQFNDCWPFE